MRAVDIIIKKRDKLELSLEEIDFFVQGFTKGDIPDYQASAFAMAVLLNGMTDKETTDLTLSMAKSGETLDLSEATSYTVDKHSTGGVGDKTSITVVPLVASCGLPVGKMSGRGLGFSGGTLDKLESIPGYRTDLTRQEFIDQLREVGAVLTGQSLDMAPADGKMYALRDVTGTVQSLPLIASSVMSKKIAAGAHAIVLDVKTGVGAFMETLEDARKLSHMMVSIGNLSNRKVVAMISDMNQPLGNAVGNALELREAIDTLQGNGPEDFHEHCIQIASQMLVLGKKAADLEEAEKQLLTSIQNGSAWEKFRQLVIKQKGNIEYVDNPEKLPKASIIETITASSDGYIQGIHAREIGETAVELGAGRARKGDPIDHAVGIIVHQKVGNQISTGDPLFTLHANDKNKFEQAKNRISNAFQWSQSPCSSLPLFYDIIQ